ncbi:prephenate dehydratase [Legionella jordanis]|uniref:Bifunctional chorismate mutase/prephenate dehydratase n=1 Tax=Legionella jordanis TaxID=456 RepID=A0A0W0VEA0_9GAMM|nr:prephenate dehydratase [Legionella jordanis]KTD18408.1 P-protein [Legionella jordanis]RMX05314.1 prephenate dehydratase [Legionella jordanis]RMX20835.1 prephenate dehydratase [Legionella jordanis]VEH13246.1 P-protein [Legionella jordanis]HAT8713597.1 prephenate dehydratase [Legionella jordanis]
MKAEDKLGQIRVDIDRIDKQILELLRERADLAAKVAQVKQQQHTPIFYRPEREAQILRSIVAQNQSLLPDHEIARIFRDIMTACLALQQPLSIAYLGPEGTFSQQAVEKHFGESVTMVPEHSITEVFKQVESGNVHYGVVPIENSTEGMVNLTLDNLINSDVQICGEISLKIHHHLARIDPEKPLKRIYAHQQTIAQCRHWLSVHYPAVLLKEVTSNGLAAQLASQEAEAAAICGDKAIEIYGLRKSHQHIEDYPNNTTRFIILGQQLPGPSGHDKTSLVISTPHEPGSLIQLLMPFEKFKINMTLIESRPYRHRNWSYLFFIDFEGHQSEPHIQAALEELAKRSVMMNLLGSYPKSMT